LRIVTDRPADIADGATCRACAPWGQGHTEIRAVRYQFFYGPTSYEVGVLSRATELSKAWVGHKEIARYDGGVVVAPNGFVIASVPCLALIAGAQKIS
jgi:hypothetical protein